MPYEFLISSIINNTQQFKSLSDLEYYIINNKEL